MQKKQISLFFALYPALRIFSYFFQPQTPLHSANPVNTTISAAILLAAIYFLWKKDEWGWYIIALEIILGGAGGYLAIGSLSLRTCLLGVSLLIYGIQKILDIKYWKLKNKEIISNIQYPIFLLIIWAGFSAARGYLGGHDIHLVVSDTIPYFFFLYYFPLRELLQSKKFKELCSNALMAAIIGNFALIIFTFIGFSSGHFALQDSYYHWYRDVSLGKITELPFHFYRLVLNEHLLLVPVLLWFIHSVIARSDEGTTKSRDATKGQSPNLNITGTKEIAASRYAGLAMTMLVVMALNLTRIYLLALVVGLLFLFTRQNLKRWLTISISTLIFFCFSFTSIHLIASRGQSLGWELFGVRLQSIASPQIEDSSLSRLLLLPKIIEKIKAHPMLGEGLGATVTVFSPIFKQEITTPHFDWGYLEIIDEMGIIGLFIWLFTIYYLLDAIRKNSLSSKNFFFASIIALLIINLTSPALFHVLGIIWVACIFTITPKFSK